MCWKRTQHAEKEVRVSFLWYVCYLEWNSNAAFWVKRLRLTKKKKLQAKGKPAKCSESVASKQTGPVSAFAERRDSHYL